MSELAPFVKEFGLAGMVVFGCAYILRVIIMWLLARTEAKDAMIDARHVELLDLTRNVMSYVNDSKEINKEFAQEVRNMGIEVKGMGEAICSKIDNVVCGKEKED